MALEKCGVLNACSIEHESDCDNTGDPEQPRLVIESANNRCKCECDYRKKPTKQYIDPKKS